MDKLSLKFKLTFFNTLIMILMVCLVLTLMITISGQIIEESSKSVIKDVVDENAEEIEYDDGILELDDVDFYKRDVRTLIYDIEGNLLAGDESYAVLITEPLIDKNLVQIDVDGQSYYVYDEYVSYKKNETVIVRGIISIDEMANVVNNIFTIAICSLPFFILLAAVGSYLLTKSSLKPVNKMIDTVNEIRNSGELSHRINLDETHSKDEIYKLATAFDSMFFKLEENFKAEKQFSSDVSHELRTPNAVILANCEMELENGKENKTIQTIQKQAIKMNTLINNLLQLTRLEFEVDKGEFMEVDFSELVLIICEESEETTDNIKFEYNIQENILADMDSNMIMRLVTNLVENAIKYSKDEGNIKITLQKKDDTIIFEVQDSGIGIGEEHLDKIFERFYKVDKSRKNNQEKNNSMGLRFINGISNC